MERSVPFWSGDATTPSMLEFIRVQCPEVQRERNEIDRLAAWG